MGLYRGSGGEALAWYSRYLPFWKLKNVMLNSDARYVPGRKSAPRKDSVFIAVLSRLLACASLLCSPAICRLILDSLCAIRLYS